MRRLFALVLTGPSILCLLACCGAGSFSTSSKPTKFTYSTEPLPPRVPEPPMSPSVAAKADLDDFCRARLVGPSGNEKAFVGKTIEISGTVYNAEWFNDHDEGLFVIMNGPSRKFVVSALFEPSQEKEVLGLHKGQSVRVRGRVKSIYVAKEKGEVMVDLDPSTIP